MRFALATACFTCFKGVWRALCRVWEGVGWGDWDDVCDRSTFSFIVEEPVDFLAVCFSLAIFIGRRCFRVRVRLRA
jgi:hypothetical protein